MSIWQIRSIQGNVYIADQVNTRQCLYGRSGQYKVIQGNVYMADQVNKVIQGNVYMADQVNKVIQGNVYMADPNKFAHANTQFLSPDPMYLRIL